MFDLNQPATIVQLSFRCRSILCRRPAARANSHVQALLSFGSLVLGAVAHDSVAVRQVEVECDQRAVLQAQGPQCGAVNLWWRAPVRETRVEDAFEIRWLVCNHSKTTDNIIRQQSRLLRRQ